MPNTAKPEGKHPRWEAPLAAFAGPVIIGFHMGGFVNGDDLTKWSDFEWLGIGLGVFLATGTIIWQHLAAKTNGNR